MPLAEANLVIHLTAILSRMPLAEANLVIHLTAILSRMPLAEANLVNTLDFIYIEHGIYCNGIHQKNFKYTIKWIYIS
jgi:predicted aconitase with swiveling domain